MVHEAMVLEYSGRHLAMIELAASLKLLLYVSVIACIFVPWVLATCDAGWLCDRLRQLRVSSWRVAGVLLAVFETSIAKMRVFRVPNFLGAALMLGLLGVLLLFVIAKACDARPRLRRRAHARRRAGAGQLHDAVPGPAVSADQHPGAAGLVLALSVAWQAYIQHAPHLYITAAIALGFKAIVIPMALRRMVFRLGIHREIETVVSIGLTMLAGIALVALSMDGDAAGHRARRPRGARGHRARPVRRAARPADDGDAAQRGQPGDRLHVAGERHRSSPPPARRACRWWWRSASPSRS